MGTDRAGQGGKGPLDGGFLLGVPVRALLVPLEVLEEEVQPEAQQGEAVLLEFFRVLGPERIRRCHSRNDGHLAVSQQHRTTISFRW